MSVFYGQFPLTIELKAPFLIAGTTPADYGVDMAQIRNHRGRAVIPDSHIKGVLRHAWEVRNGGDSGVNAYDLFGRGGDDIDNNGGRLWFTDLVAADIGKAPSVTRVGLDADTGAVRRGALFVIEQIARPGAVVEFTGTVTMRADNRQDAQSICDEIGIALRFVSSIGKFKTAGFGQLVGHKVGTLEEIPRGANEKAYAPGQYRLSFGVNKPLLVDSTRPDGNTFSGSQVITGGTIKGALAAKLQVGGFDPTSGDLGKTLSMMEIGHAFPNGPDMRPIPLDHVQHDKDQPPVLPPSGYEPDYRDEKHIPAFAPDFKGDTKRKYLTREYRTHVKIDAGKGAAENSALFSTSSVLHEDEQPFTWRTTVRLPDNANDAQKTEFSRCLNELDHGLFTLGKTKARTVETAISPAKATGSSHGTDDWRLVLDTPLLMLREYHLSNEALYWAAIREYWSQATGGCYRLKVTDGLPRMFARQSFASGFPALRFPWFDEDRLEPFVLTDPGSVFVLECVDKAAGPNKRAELEKSGLPVALWTLPDPPDRQRSKPGELDAIKKPDFNICPYGPQNGYGHIRAEDAS